MTTNSHHSHVVERYAQNASGRDFAVGDVHGCFSLLDAELAARGFDPSRDRLFSVGDLIDRGEESPSVLEAMRRHQIKAVRGNHEQGILDWLSHKERAYDADRIKTVRANADKGIDGWAYQDSSTKFLILNGAEWFIRLYCSSEKGAANTVRDIRSYLASLPYAIEIETTHGRVGIVHADPLVPQWDNLIRILEHGPSDAVERNSILINRLRWRPNAWAAPMEDVSAVIVGHTPTREIAQRGSVMNIDTAAVYGNKLTILNLAEIPEYLAAGERGIS
ncbi:metallophosphoesterase [Paraburkholderia sp. B3]|uniref:metallophosphoesterase n=1 Tax=Paraburkholderia sp. B3 TaxID=3134791 RepID=UPI003982D455